jgi:hypothetical protein
MMWANVAHFHPPDHIVDNAQDDQGHDEQDCQLSNNDSMQPTKWNTYSEEGRPKFSKYPSMVQNHPTP